MIELLKQWFTFKEVITEKVTQKVQRWGPLETRTTTSTDKISTDWYITLGNEDYDNIFINGDLYVKSKSITS
jgi:S1-C subfamily serine protease